jgi:tetraacyldisaccharide 4'-kinase
MTTPAATTTTANHAPPLGGFLGRSCAAVYGSLVQLRNGWYDVNPGRKIDRPVVSVGNLSVGGTGKTPMVVHLVRMLKAAGRTPAIAMRGYASPTGSPADSDEAQQYLRALPGIALAAGKDRLAELKEMFTTRRGKVVDCVVLDDGFQHRQLWRDVDLVLIDATRSPFDDRLLPAGWLRERVEGLSRASGVIITHAEAVPATTIDHLVAQVRRVTSKDPLAVCRHEWRALVSGEGQQERTLPADFFKGRRIVVSCAIGNPSPFLARAKAGGEVVASQVLRDHDPYADATVRTLADLARSNRADAILVTEKDWSKLRSRPPESFPCPVLRPRLELGFLSGERALEDLIVGAVRAFRHGK